MTSSRPPQPSWGGVGVLYQPPKILTLVRFRSSHLSTSQILCCRAAPCNGGDHGTTDRGDAAGAVGGEASAACGAKPGRPGGRPDFGASPCAGRVVAVGGCGGRLDGAGGLA